MKTIEEQIEVMQHFANGGEVEFYNDFQEIWIGAATPLWNWNFEEYRIKEQKKTITIEKWLCKHKKNDECYKIFEVNETFFKTLLNEWIKIKILESKEIEL